MLDFSVSWLPLVVVAVANFILSWIYYSPAVPWFSAWVKGVGANPDPNGMTAEQKAMLPFQFGGAILACFLLAYGLQVVIHSLHIVDFWSGAIVGAVLLIGFNIPASLNTLFEGRKPVILVINTGLYLLTYLGFGGLVAIWR